MKNVGYILVLSVVWIASTASAQNESIIDNVQSKKVVTFPLNIQLAQDPNGVNLRKMVLQSGESIQCGISLDFGVQPLPYKGNFQLKTRYSIRRSAIYFPNVKYVAFQFDGEYPKLGGEMFLFNELSCAKIKTDLHHNDVYEDLTDVELVSYFEFIGGSLLIE